MNITPKQIINKIQSFPQSTLSEWRGAFWVCFAVLVGTNVIYCIWADGKQQWWDDVRQYGYPPEWKHGSLIKEDNPEVPESIKLSEEKE